MRESKKKKKRAEIKGRAEKINKNAEKYKKNEERSLCCIYILFESSL